MRVSNCTGDSRTVFDKDHYYADLVNVMRKKLEKCIRNS
jgi:hypothetical protein